MRCEPNVCEWNPQLSSLTFAGLYPVAFRLILQLGATLANNRQSEEALPAYRRAIASKPGYARAWLNMGISQVGILPAFLRMPIFTSACGREPSRCWKRRAGGDDRRPRPFMRPLAVDAVSFKALDSRSIRAAELFSKR